MTAFNITCLNTSTPQQVVPQTAAGDTYKAPVTLLGSSGVEVPLNIALIVNQSGTAGYSGVFLDVTETATGSGVKNVLDLQVASSGIFSVSNTGLHTQKINAGLTADAGSIQGGTPLTSTWNEVSTVGTIADSVTLPLAIAGQKVTIFNTAANALDVFPALGDDLGAGVDTAASLAGGANITYLAIDAITWISVT